MAAYDALFDLASNSALRNKVIVGCYAAAEVVRAENPATTNHANRVKWAKRVLEAPDPAGAAMLRYLIGANSGLTTTQIQQASDATIQAAVNNAIDIFADGT